VSVLLDTSAYSNFLRANTDVIELIAGSDSVYISPVVIGELNYGFLKGEKTDDNLKVLHRFLSKKEVIICEIDQNTANTYAQLKFEQYHSGKIVAPNDLWITASAINMGARLVTFDRDFLQITSPDLQLILL
jgi:predicted nucleic acid-binding protein